MKRNKYHNILMVIFHWFSTSLSVFSSSETSSAHESPQRYNNEFFWIPVIVGAVTTMTLLGLYGWDSTAVVFAALILIISMFSGWWLSRHHIQTIKRLIQKQEESRSEETAFYSQILPIWSKQITTSRHTGDNAVAELAVIFSGIVSRLKSILKTSGQNTHTEHGYEKDFLATVATNQTNIQTIFKDLKTALEIVNDSKDMLLAEITMYSANMKEMAVESHQVAFQSQIIALNAEIEAARAGEAGRAFAAVVSEMRQLARQSGETSKRMTSKVESIDNAMVRFYKEDQVMAVKEAQQVSCAETLFKNILESFSKATLEMEASISTMESESRHIQDDISSALIALQFQDSVSQIMAHVADNINALNESSGADTWDFNVNKWLDDMQSKFSVDAEHENINDNQTTSSQASSLTFF